MKIAVLIGAGASYGAGGIAPERPPLGYELFDRLQNEFPDSWGALLNDVEHEAFKGDPPFETGMKMLWENNDERLPRLLIDMAIYFSQFCPDGGPNCYAALLRLLMTTSRIDVFFCSLNYECVFEQIAEQVGLDLINLGRGRRKEGRHACLYKPHGSCNYIDPLTRNFYGTIAGSPHYIYRDHPALTDFEVLNCPDVKALYDTGVMVPPVMSLYVATKHSPVGSTLMNMIREAWAQGAASAEVILTIGARPVLADDHIWGPVIGSSATVWFVGGQEDAYSALEDAIGGRLQPLASRFDLAIPALRRRLAPLAG